MANTYTQLYVQIVFDVKERDNFIIEKRREELKRYICGIISNKRCKPIAIFCKPDYKHILILVRFLSYAAKNYFDYCFYKDIATTLQKENFSTFKINK